MPISAIKFDAQAGRCRSRCASSPAAASWSLMEATRSSMGVFCSAFWRAMMSSLTMIGGVSPVKWSALQQGVNGLAFANTQVRGFMKV